jgi:hypothetical protein
MGNLHRCCHHRLDATRTPGLSNLGMPTPIRAKAQLHRPPTHLELTFVHPSPLSPTAAFSATAIQQAQMANRPRSEHNDGGKKNKMSLEVCGFRNHQRLMYEGSMNWNQSTTR